MIIVYILLALIIAILIAAWFMPSSYNVEKTVIIKRPAADVISRVADLNYYKQWNPWQQTDSSSQGTITGTPGTPGHKYAWQGKKIGMGSLTLKSMDAKHVHFDLQFLKPWKATASDNWLFEPWGDGNEVKVTWQNSGGLSWPIARLMGPMLNKSLNQQFEAGLVNLKKMCEG